MIFLSQYFSYPKRRFSGNILKTPEDFSGAFLRKDETLSRDFLRPFF